jgi:hypothetical protein
LISAGALWYSAKSAEAAIDAVNLQRLQTIEAGKQDSINAFRDSVKYAETLRLTQEHLAILSQQAAALREDVRNTKASQSPDPSVIQVGFHRILSSEFHRFKYKIENRGKRTMILKSISSTFFSNDFKVNSSVNHHYEARLTPGNVFEHGLQITIDGKGTDRITANDISKINSSFLRIGLTYLDPTTSIVTIHPAFFYRWDNKSLEELMYMEEGAVQYIPFYDCEAGVKEKIEDAFKKYELNKR